MLLPDGAYRVTVIFTSGDTDFAGRVDGRALLRRFQDAAGDHFEALHLGRDVAVAHGCFWAAVRTAVEIYRTPPTGLALTLETWPNRPSHGLFPRHYVLTDQKGEILLRGVSVWVLMDMETRTLSRDRDWIPPSAGLSRPGELSVPRRIRIPEGLTGKCTRTVTAEEADVNGHLNNAEYLRWGEDLADGELAAARRLRRFEIEYKKELPLGAAAELTYMTEGGSLFVRGRSNDSEAFLMRCDYDPI